jgi:tRNA-dihydrouridine synthase
MNSADGTYQQLPLAERFALLRRQIRESVERIDEYRGILHVRRHLAASPLFKGIPSFRETRIAMLRANTLAELESILDSVEQMLSK